MGLKEFIPFFKEEKKIEERKDELGSLQYRVRLLEMIVGRYRELIEEKEKKSISDLKSLIRPNDETVQRKKDEIVAGIRPYIYEQSFLKAAEMSHKAVSELKTHSTPVDFWLSPKEMLELKGGDPMDKAVFLCSLLVALENPDVHVIIGLNKGMKVAVGFMFDGTFHIMDPVSPAGAEGNKESLIGEWFREDRKVYEFNDRHYAEIKSDEQEGE